VPAVFAVAAAGALLLPWHRAARGPVLLGAGPLRELPADAWTGTDVAGPRAVLPAALVLVAAVLAVHRWSVSRLAAVTAGGASVATAGAALGGWGPSAVPGLWVTLAAGLAAVGAALLSPPRRPAGAPLLLAAALLAAAVTAAVPGGPTPPIRPAVGPFVPVAAVGAFPMRSGAAGLAGALDDARPVVADGAPGIVTRSGIVVADAWHRARVLARTDRGAPPVLGVAGDRLARWAGPDTVAVSELRAGSALDVVVRDVAAASRVGTDGSVWLRSVIDPPQTVRWLDLAARSGAQTLSATYLPVVTIQSPDGEAPLDVRAVLPVRGGALRLGGVGGVPQLQRLTATAVGIAVAPVAGAVRPMCGPSAARSADLRTLASDGTGVWFPAVGPDDDRLVHLDPDGTLRTVAAPLPGRVAALAAPGDGSLLLTTRDAVGDALWRLPDAQATLAPAAGCTPG
jgi:hypothetical protein